MSPGRKNRKSKPASFLSRLLGRGQKSDGRGRAAGKKAQARGGEPSRDTAAASEKARPLTPRERSVEEVKQMTRLGRRDPERLAALLTAILAKERARQQLDQQSFERQVSSILERDEQGGDQAGGADAGGEPSPAGPAPDGC
jgi:hypothetical protein